MLWRARHSIEQKTGKKTKTKTKKTATLFITSERAQDIVNTIRVNRVRRPHPDCCVHSSCGQPLDSSVGAVLEVQAVNRFLVVPCNLTRYQLHCICSSNTACAGKRDGLCLALRTDGIHQFPAMQRTHIEFKWIELWEVKAGDETRRLLRQRTLACTSYSTRLPLIFRKLCTTSSSVSPTI